MTWWGVVLIGLGCFYFGYFTGALMRIAKTADEIVEGVAKHPKEKEE